MLPRHPRRARPSRPSLRLAAAGVLLVAPALASCGFDEATNRVNQITAGASTQGGTINVLNLLIVSEDAGSGTLHGLLANLDEVESIALTSVSGANGRASATLESVEVDPLGRAQISEGDARVTGSFAAGQVIPLSLGFDDGTEITMNAHVVDACGQYTGLDSAPQAGDPDVPEVAIEEEPERIPCGAETRGATNDTGSAGESEESQELEEGE